MTITRKRKMGGGEEEKILPHKMISEKSIATRLCDAQHQKTLHLSIGMSIHNFNSICQRFFVNFLYK